MICPSGVSGERFGSSAPLLPGSAAVIDSGIRLCALIPRAWSAGASLFTAPVKKTVQRTLYRSV